jgi:AraC-like DNA-binding protein
VLATTEVTQYVNSSCWQRINFALFLQRQKLQMKIYTLPQDIFPGGRAPDDSIIFHNYEAPAGSFNGKSILSKNAISLVISGEKRMHFAEKEVYVNNREFHFLSAGNCLVSMKLDRSVPFKSFIIFFDNSVLSNFFSKYSRQVTAARSHTIVRPEHYIAFTKDDFVIHFIGSLQLLRQSGSGISMEMKLLKFEELMLHLLEQYPAKLLAFKPAGESEFDDPAIRAAVESNITKNISIEELAFLCNTSVSTFKRRFAKIFHTSPNKWILHRRMQLARELLQRQGERPADVFYKVGYENHSSFSKSFKQTFGITPQGFQKQQLNVQQ